MPLPSDYAAAAVPPASPRAYAVLFAPAESREALTALYALDAEIAAATSARVEHSVAHTKLEWWRGEVDRLAAGRPQHPISRALHGAVPPPFDWSRLHERLAGAELRIAGYAPATTAELDALLYRTHGVLQQLAAELLGGADAEALHGFGAHLGRGLGLVDAIRGLRQDVIDGCPRLALDQLDAAGVAVESLARGPLPPVVAPILAAQAERAREAFAAARASLPASAARAQAHGRVLAALADALLAELQRTEFDVTTWRELHPLRQLWLAWRSARRA